jgi:hypothetical protein
LHGHLIYWLKWLTVARYGFTQLSRQNDRDFDLMLTTLISLKMWEKEADKHLGEEHRPVAAVERRILQAEQI